MRVPGTQTDLKPVVRRRSGPVGLTLASLILLIGLGGAGLWLLNEQREARRTLVVAVPPGTAARVAAGEKVELFPQTVRLNLNRQDTLVVRNDDSEPVTIGPYRVEPGQRFVQRFESPGTFDMVCSIHEGEGLRIIVTR